MHNAQDRSCIEPAQIATSGFTLLELLVTVSIIALLAAILLPAIMQSRAATRRTICLSNLRQWALAVRMYADAHHGRLPYRGQGVQPTTRLDAMDDWINAIPQFAESQPYIELVAANQKPKAGDSSIWICPEAVSIDQLHTDELDPAVANHIDPTTFFAYGMNMALSTPYMGRPDHIDRVGPLQTMVFMADGLGPYCSVIPHKKDYMTSRLSHGTSETRLTSHFWMAALNPIWETTSAAVSATQSGPISSGIHRTRFGRGRRNKMRQSNRSSVKTTATFLAPRFNTLFLENANECLPPAYYIHFARHTVTGNGGNDWADALQRHINLRWHRVHK